MNDIVYAGKHTVTYRVPRHEHDTWELIYCTGQGGELQFDDFTLPYEVGTVVVIPPHTPHANVSQIGFTKSLSAHYAPSVIVMYQFLLGTVYFLPLLFTKGIRDFDAGLYLSWDVLYPTLSLALFCSATAFTSWAYAIKVLGVAKTSVFLAVVPLVTAVLAFLVGEETATGLQWMGLAIAMVGIYLTQRAPVNPDL